MCLARRSLAPVRYAAEPRNEQIVITFSIADHCRSTEPIPSPPAPPPLWFVATYFVVSNVVATVIYYGTSWPFVMSATGLTSTYLTPLIRSTFALTGA